MILGALGALFGVGLAFASKAFEVKLDPRIALVREALPGANCAACGYTGCDGYAAAVAAGEAAPNLCPVGGRAVAERIAGIMGVEAGAVAKKVARVHCAGRKGMRKDKYGYVGTKTCAAAAMLHGGPSGCDYGCLGFGDCVKACAFGAMYMDDGVAAVIASRCTACGMCAGACPKKLVTLEAAEAGYTVLCMNKERGALTRKNCAVGCIGCMRCQKACLVGAARVADNLASIDQAKCSRCGECMHLCPQRCIAYFDCEAAREEA